MVTNPLPASLPEECRKATKLFSAFCDPENGFDKVVPVSVLRRAKGFAFLTVVKAGFLFSVRAGTGVVVARLPDGSWSTPSAIGTAGAGAGFQVGAEMTEFVIILNSRAAVASFTATGSLTLGGNLSIAAGPIGRNVEGTGTISSKGGVSAMYSYSRTKGLFGGASVEGSVIVERSDANRKAYGFDVTAKQLLSGSIDTPPWAEQLLETISRRSGSRVRDEDTEEGDNRDGEEGRERSGSGSYSFGSAYASGGADTSSPSRASAMGSKLAAIGSSISSVGGRSRSGSNRSNKSATNLGGRSRSSSYVFQPPAVSSASRFDQDFGDEYRKEVESSVSSGGGQRTMGDEWRNTSSSPAPKVKLTKPRSGSGGVRGMAEGMRWDELDRGDSSRASFDSLQDNEGEYSNSPPRRTSPPRITKTNFSGPSSSPALQSNSNDTASPFSDLHTTSRPDLQPTSRKSYSTKPWESEDEELMQSSSNSPAALRSRAQSLSRNDSSNQIVSPLVNKGDPFDFSEVEVDFSRLREANGLAYDAKAAAGNRSRSSTVGKGIGSAIALFDFKGAEAGDLPFKKGDVITILKKDDEEWWTGRLKVQEGLFPGNYVEVHLD